MNKIDHSEDSKVTLKVTQAESGKESTHEVEAKPLTVVCHPGDIDVNPADNSKLSTITAVDTVGMANSLHPEVWAELRTTPRFKELFSTVFEFDPPEKLVTDATKHVTGMILLIAMAVSKGKKPFLKLPETHLHPKQQANLADMFVKMQKGPSG